MLTANQVLFWQAGSHCRGCVEGDWVRKNLTQLRLLPDDPRYRAVVEKRFNKRFSARPDYVRLAGSTDEVIAAVGEAVREGRRLVVTSGGHCLEGFVSDPEVRVIIDVSPMKRVYFDAERGAVAVEAGATVGETFRALYREVGRGRTARRVSRHRHGRARGRRRVRLPLPPARPRGGLPVRRRGRHRGRGRTGEQRRGDPRAVGSEPRALVGAHRRRRRQLRRRHALLVPIAGRVRRAIPPTLLPRAPESITTFRAEWSWSDIDRPAFLRLLRNHGIWCERNSDADSPYASLWTLFAIHRKQFGKIVVRGVSTAGDAAERQVDDISRRSARESSRRQTESRRGCRGSSSR